MKDVGWVGGGVGECMHACMYACIYSTRGVLITLRHGKRPEPNTYAQPNNQFGWPDKHHLLIMFWFSHACPLFCTKLSSVERTSAGLYGLEFYYTLESFLLCFHFFMANVLSFFLLLQFHSCLKWCMRFYIS